MYDLIALQGIIPYARTQFAPLVPELCLFELGRDQAVCALQSRVKAWKTIKMVIYFAWVLVRSGLCDLINRQFEILPLLNRLS
jgi:hypothetical protein